LTRYSQYIRLTNIVGDLIILNSSYYVAARIKFAELPNNFFLLLLYINVIWWLVSTVLKPYKISRTSKLHQVIGATYGVLFFHILLVFAYYVFEQSNRFSRELLLITYGLIFVLLFVWKIFFIILLRWFRKKGYNYRNIIVIADPSSKIQIQPYIKQHPEDGYRIQYVFDPKDKNRDEFHEEIKIYCLNNEVHEIFYAISVIHHNTLLGLMDFAEDNFIKIKLIADFKSVMFRTLELEYFGLTPILKIVSTPLDHFKNLLIKRIFDVVFSCLTIVFLLSWLIPILSILIILTSKGTPFFKQKRTGKDNKTFNCYKLRTMYINNDSDRLQATKNDERITPIGKFLRETSLDELPQFFNVLIGNMSIVGPRPHMLKHTQDFSDELELFMARHKIKPGITGLAQTKGYRGETKDFEQRKNRVKMDLFYLKNWSFLLDLSIIVNTILDVYRGNKK
jgi:putative colanic acid biosynthesis UDP-glucose lipid carrier transferase